MLRLILRQPSPHWSNFSIDEIKCFPHSTVSSPLLKRCLQNNDCYDPFGIKSPQNRPNSAGVASNIQELWAMTQEVKTSKQRATVGRFDVDRSYDINLLSYTWHYWIITVGLFMFSKLNESRITLNYHYSWSIYVLQAERIKDHPKLLLQLLAGKRIPEQNLAWNEDFSLHAPESLQNTVAAIRSCKELITC